MSKQYIKYLGYRSSSGDILFPYGLKIVDYKNRSDKEIKEGVEYHNLVIDYIKKISECVIKDDWGIRRYFGHLDMERLRLLEYDDKIGYVVKAYNRILYYAKKKDYSIFPEIKEQLRS